MKLRNKILLSIIVLIFALSASFIYFVVGKSSDLMIGKEVDRGMAVTKLFAINAVTDNDDVDPSRFSDRIRSSFPAESNRIAYVIVSGPKGQVMFGAPPRGALGNTEWNKALDAPVVQRACPDLDFPEIEEFIAPIVTLDAKRTKALLGTVRVGISFDSIYSERRKMFITMGILIALIAFAGVGLANYISKSVTETIDSLVHGVDTLGRGELSHRIDVVSADEIGALGAAFNQMADRLRISRVKIENYSRDLEEMVRARTAELRKAYDELKRLDELKDTFLSSVSHELRTPLTSIHSFAEILMNYGDEDPNTRKEFLGIIKRETERLSRLIDDVLDLAKIEAGMVTWKVAKHDLRAILEDAIAAIKPLMDASKVSVHFSYPPRLPQVLGDRDRLSQVVTNLLSNARKFTKTGDTVDVRLNVDSGYLRCEVEDHGIGIAPDNLEKVFEKFRQVEDEHLTDKPKGTGLGLPISRDIIQVHGGKLWAESELGKGTTFIFTIPTADNPEPRPISEYLETIS